MKNALFLAAFLSTALLFAQPRLSPKNIDKVLKSMTLEEKAQLLVGSIDGGGYTGLPMPTGNDEGYQRVPGAAGQTNTIPRLGIPPTVVADGPGGVRISRPATGFPTGICLASTWNMETLYEVGAALGNETREFGVDVILGPGNNLMRNPLNGRNVEYYSEDPILSGKLAAAMIRGIQSEGVGACVKHFAANNQETNRNENDSRVSEKALRELYLKAFEIAIKEGDPWCVMSAYNKLNGEYCESNYWLLTTILRDEWGYKGIVMTDWTAPRDAAAQVSAGNDLLMPGKKEQIDDIISAVQKGRLKMADVDKCVRRMLEYIVKTPRFHSYVNSDAPDLGAHAVIARKASAEGMVLLRNEDSALPLKGGKAALFGVHSYSFITGCYGSGHVNVPHAVNLKEGLENQGFETEPALAAYYEKLMDAQREAFSFSPMAKIPFLKNIGVGAPFHDEFLPSYVYASEASVADFAIVTIGRKTGEGYDRNIEGDFNLTETEKSMISGAAAAFHAAGKKLIVILNIGGPVETASWRDDADAILVSWIPGEEGGNAVADILTGAVNPSGKLPVTFPMSYADVPGAGDFPVGYGTWQDWLGGVPFKGKPESETRNYDYTDYSEDMLIGYRYYKAKGIELAYPFGFGLSYTTFGHSPASIRRVKGKSVVAVTVTNTGSVPGADVVQFYDPDLRAFGKTRILDPGESQTLEMNVY